jgi:peptidyl-prolyl cis-trans isomerase D
MFTHLRQTAQGFFAKVILFLLTGMFILWGIGDVFRNMGAGSSSVATVGKTTITIQEVKRAERQSNASPQQAVASLIKTALIANEAKALGIVVSDDDVVAFVHDIPELQGKDGQFDKNKYLAVIGSNGRSEQQFLEDLRQEIMVKLLIGPLTGGIQVPGEMVQAIYRTYEEQRAASLLYIPEAAVRAQVPAPAEQEIKAYYDAHTKEFLAPETRMLSYVVLPIADVQSKIDVAEDEIKRVYEERKDDFHQPERRQVEDLVFDNEPDVKDAAAKLAHGATWESVAASAPVLNKGKTALGLVAMQEVPKEAAGQIFSLKQGAVTPPVMSDFRWHLYHVGTAVPSRPDTYEEARPLIAKDIAARQAQETLSKLASGFEDSLAGGATLDQAAEKIGQKLHTLGPVTREGMTADGKKADLPPYDNFLTVAFATAEKDHSQAVQAPDGSYFLVRVDSVALEHIRPLAEVKEQAAKAALAQNVKAKLRKVAQELSEQLRAGKKSAADVLAASGLAIKFVPVGHLRRTSETVEEGELKNKTLPQPFMAELFRMSPQQTTHAYPTADDGYAIATLTQVTPAPANPDPKVMQAIHDELADTLAREILHQYLEALRSKYPITINAAALGLKDEDGGE